MWDYQIVKNELGIYTVREVVNFKKKEKSWTVDEISPWGESRDEIRKCITMYINDISKLPILIVEGDKVVGEEPPLSESSTEEQ